MRLIGRDPERALLRAFTKDLARGPHALVLEGSVGLGKTALFTAALADARDDGVRILRAAPAEPETWLPFVVLGDLVREHAAEWGSSLPGPQRRAIEIALLLAEPADEPPTPEAVGLATLGVLRSLAGGAPLLVAIDDDQWTDTSSSRALAFAARRLGDAAIGFLVARRPHAPDGLGPALAGSLGPDGCGSVTIGPLSAGALQTLVDDRLGIVLPRPVLRRVHEACGGSPLHALELTRAIGGSAATLAPDQPLPVPETLEELVTARVAGLAKETQAALAMAALAIAPSLDLLAAAGIAEPAAALAPAAAADLVAIEGRSLGFSHPLYASAIAARLPPGRQRELHAVLAYAVAPVEDRARHLALAADGPDEPAAAALEQAAEQAALRGASELAVDLLEIAVSVTPPGVQAALVRRLLVTSAACHKTADLVRAKEHAHAALGLIASGPARAEALLALAAASVIDGVAACEQALAEAGADAGLRARIRSQLCDRRLLVDLDAALGDARSGVADAREAGDDARTSELLGMLGFVEAAAGRPEAEAHLEEATRLERSVGGLPAEFSPAMNRAIAAMWRDDLAGARDGFRRMLRRARDAGDEHGAVFVLLHLTQTEWRAGHLREAETWLAEAQQAWMAAGEDQVLGIMLWLRSAISGHRGRLDEARAAARESLARNLDDRLFGARQQAALGFVELQSGDAAAAVERFAAARDLSDELGVREPGVVLYAGDEIEALVAAGRLDDAATRVADLVRVGDRLGRPRLSSIAARGQGLLLMATDDLEGAMAVLVEGIVEADPAMPGLDYARGLLALGAAQRRDRRRADARRTLQAAQALFSDAGADGFALQARAEMDRIGGRARAEDGLTPAEASIAELVATGRSNKEVAITLFLSPRTVEGALTRIYGKLGVRSRAELAHHFKTDAPT